ncbi:conserved hypothetical protein [Uncinocarpus reesii 1704]|uniref:Helicase C-terminal domain-containing protein n=1 Tax=Uncinocarpus reesii (strain UAMH 1704) TaxID=336963 RepID=C4JRL9_UNCRE|nr:uncharacterized protein UREG_05108 [Uncinocarpus reesii 1704]EEP80266.1 conserved hypothetical protein [Uncinocarpus reesii 1704]
MELHAESDVENLGFDELADGELNELESTIAEGGENEDGGGHRSSRENSIFSSRSASISLASTPSSKSSFSPASRYATEKEIFLGDLDNFIPVGILKRFNRCLKPGEPVPAAQGPEYPQAEVQSLVAAGWIRTSLCRNEIYSEWIAMRVYVLPEDVGRSIIPRASVPLHRALKVVMSRLDISPEAWMGRFHPTPNHLVNNQTGVESLFYIFNTLDSPDPKVASVADPWARMAMEEILEGGIDGGEHENVLPGLLTPLYPYQRRSAALMIQKETQPGEYLDPRLELFTGPTGQTYYYDKEEGAVTQDERLFSRPCGGVLAETMGYGKTLICLAVILATKGHLPQIPPEHVSRIPKRAQIGSLLEMAASVISRHSVPWKAYFDRMSRAGLHYTKCIDVCKSHQASYVISQTPKYVSRKREDKITVQLSSGTLVIVPPNLVDHWLHEIRKHTQGLKLLVLRNKSDLTPPVISLLEYDIILFSRTRFEGENGDPLLQPPSPLKEIHWLRIIVDEGHNFASTGGKSNAIHFLDQLHVERRWVVSGTPSSGMYGIEVSLASQETIPGAAKNDDEVASAILKARRKSIVDEELKNLDKLKRIVVDFLGMKPWANCGSRDPARWARYIKPIDDDGTRVMAASLRPTLQSVVVRHRVEDINKDLTLPNLSNKVVYLEPTFYDKLSVNMFIFQLTVNAITSERTDEDYMFHPKNRKHLAALISNLRFAGFWWTGFKSNDIVATLNIANKYLEKHREMMTESDLKLLCEGILIAEKTIACPSWNAFSSFDELGVFIRDFPEHARGVWSIDSLKGHQQPILLGISQARDAQKFVTGRLCEIDPAEGMVGAGIKKKRELQARLVENDKRPRTVLPTKTQAESAAIDSKTGNGFIHRPQPETLPNAKASCQFRTLPTDSPLANTKIVATASAKLSYLLDRVLEFQETEKIIIFYENNNNAFWVAEGLEILGVEFRIYASTLKPNLKSEYLSMFNNSEEVRVLLMDLRQASHGLHVASASRIFIINPIWDPNIESQAIKRAHRISQTRPVYVETLVLRNTLEDKMLRRRKQMSNAEMQHAERDLLDDATMSSIIQAGGFIPIFDDETDSGLALMKSTPGFFDRHQLPVQNKSKGKKSAPSSRQTPAKRKRKAADPIPFLDSDVSPGSVRRSKRRRTAASDTHHPVLVNEGLGLVLHHDSPSDNDIASTNISQSSSAELDGDDASASHAPPAN